MAARYSVYPPISADEYYCSLMQAYLDQLQVDLRRQQQERFQLLTLIEAKQAETYVPVQQNSTTATSTDVDSAPSTVYDHEKSAVSNLTNCSLLLVKVTEVHEADIYSRNLC